MKIYKNRAFNKWAIKAKIADKLLDRYPCYLKMQVSVGIKSTLGKALIEGNGCSLGEINNAE